MLLVAAAGLARVIKPTGLDGSTRHALHRMEGDLANVLSADPPAANPDAATLSLAGHAVSSKAPAAKRAVAQAAERLPAKNPKKKDMSAERQEEPALATTNFQAGSTNIRAHPPGATDAEDWIDMADFGTDLAHLKQNVAEQQTSLRELNVCTNGLRSWGTDWQERSSAIAFVAQTMGQNLRNIQDSGIPLHSSFLRNANMLAAMLFRVAWWAQAIVSSPYFHLYHAGVNNIAQYVGEARLNFLAENDKISIKSIANKTGEQTKMLLQAWRFSTMHKLANVGVLDKEGNGMGDLAESLTAGGSGKMGDIDADTVQTKVIERKTMSPMEAFNLDVADETALRMHKFRTGKDIRLRLVSDETGIPADSTEAKAEGAAESALASGASAPAPAAPAPEAAPEAAAAPAEAPAEAPAAAPAEAPAAEPASLQRLHRSLLQLSETPSLSETISLLQMTETMSPMSPMMGGMMPGAAYQMRGVNGGARPMAPQTGGPVERPAAKAAAATAGMAADTQKSYDALKQQFDTAAAQAAAAQQRQASISQQLVQINAVRQQMVEQQQAQQQLAAQQQQAAQVAQQAQQMVQQQQGGAATSATAASQQGAAADTIARQAWQQQQAQAKAFQQQVGLQPGQQQQQTPPPSLTSYGGGADASKAAYLRGLYPKGYGSQQEEAWDHLSQQDQQLLAQYFGHPAVVGTAPLSSSNRSGVNATMYAAALPAVDAWRQQQMQTLPKLSPVARFWAQQGGPPSQQQQSLPSEAAPATPPPGSSKVVDAIFKIKAAQAVAQKQAQAVVSLRENFGMAGDGLSDLADRSSASSDQLLCVRNEMTDLLAAGLPIPRFIISAWGYANFGGQVLLRMWLMLFASRGSAYELCLHLLYTCNQYLGLLWQSISASSAVKGAGAYGTVEFLDQQRMGLGLPG